MYINLVFSKKHFFLLCNELLLPFLAQFMNLFSWCYSDGYTMEWIGNRAAWIKCKSNYFIYKFGWQKYYDRFVCGYIWQYFCLMRNGKGLIPVRLRGLCMKGLNIIWFIRLPKFETWWIYKIHDNWHVAYCDTVTSYATRTVFNVYFVRILIYAIFFSF